MHPAGDALAERFKTVDFHEMQFPGAVQLPGP